MIQEFVNAFIEREAEIREQFRYEQPSYDKIVKVVVDAISKGSDLTCDPDPNKIVSLYGGDYQGEAAYLIGSRDDDFWYVKVAYGSCGHCDALQRISDLNWHYEGDWEATEEQLDQYMTLALHIMQGIKKLR